MVYCKIGFEKQGAGAIWRAPASGWRSKMPTVVQNATLPLAPIPR